MSPLNSDFDALIATLHPHIIMSLYNFELKPPRSLRSRNLQKDRRDLQMLAQAFASLFRFHPQCDAAAVAVRFTKPEHTSFSICLSPSTPADFHSTLDKWLAHLTALLRVDESEFKGDLNASGYQEDSLSSSEEQFVLHAYKVCYPAMHQLIADHGFGDWKIFVEEEMTVPRRSYWVPIGEQY
uniref:Reducing polyketide synthase DEP5 ) n=1 Tax=Ganoderma boninense TaxID=34458 RepID=A0A5K1JWU6_9APHY|nr:Reducing polyketide synthase DEP5 (EC (Depudecin biosynthesis cluster protein 1) [Ganoderma boninense]